MPGSVTTAIATRCEFLLISCPFVLDVMLSDTFDVYEAKPIDLSLLPVCYSPFCLFPFTLYEPKAHVLVLSLFLVRIIDAPWAVRPVLCPPNQTAHRSEPFD